MYTIGKLVATWLKPVSMQVATYSRDSDHLIKKLHDLGKIKPNEFLFTADAIAIYPNIDTEEGTIVIILSFKLNIMKYNVDLYMKPLLRALCVMMKYNVFKFSDTYYRQKDGIAIGSVPALD